MSGPWGQLSPHDRGRLIWNLAELIEARKAIFGQLDALDNGKPFAVARDVDAVWSARHFRYFAGWPDKIEGATIPVSTPNRLNHTRIEPMGVCGLITPWNYPTLMVAWKLAPALAAGNTIVLKPAEQTPLSALYLADLALEAGFPPGVLNVVPGLGGDAGAALAAHPGVDKIGFTGSTATGRQIVMASAGNLKKVSLELDGLRKLAEGLSVGPGMDLKGHDLGPVISRVQMDKVLGYIADGRTGGAQCIAGGGRLGDTGWFVQPTILAGVSDDMRVAREEIFGPVLCVLPFDDEDEVLARANDSEYGLAAGCWTRNAGCVARMGAGLHAGTVWINCWGDTDAASPFGGMGQSGYGREMGRDALALYTQTKSVWQGL